MVIAAIVGGVWLVVTFGFRGLAQFASMRSGRLNRPRRLRSECAAEGRYGALKIALGALVGVLFLANWSYLIAREVGGS